MSRYIDADELYERMQDICAYYEEGVEVKEEALSIVYHFHTADVEQVRHGKWDVWGEDHCCSICGKWALFDPFEHIEILSNFCPYCGAKMDGEKEE